MSTLVQNLLEDHIPVVKYAGIKTNQNITVGGSADIDLSGSTGVFKFPTGVITGNDSVALAATFAEINSVADQSARIVNATAATLTVTQATHSEKIITLNRAAGIAVTLPAATGSGGKYTFVVGTTFTGTATIAVASNTDYMVGTATLFADSGDTVVGFATANSGTVATESDTISLFATGNATGGIKGAIVEIVDIASAVFFVRYVSDAGGTEATPFSAAV